MAEADPQVDDLKDDDDDVPENKAKAKPKATSKRSTPSSRNNADSDVVTAKATSSRPQRGATRKVLREVNEDDEAEMEF